MATQNEIFAVYVNADLTLGTARVLADNVGPLADSRDVIMLKFRRPNPQGGWFTDQYDGWRGYAVKRFQGKAGAQDGATITRSRPKDGPQAAEGRNVDYNDDSVPGNQKIWPPGMEQAAMAGGGPSFRGFDPDDPNYSTLLAQAAALNPDDTPLS